MAPMRGGFADGERVSHLFPNDLYQAHASLYEHAARFARGGRVLDVGCGTGYGCAIIADAGAASVLGVDVDAEAVAFAAAHFPRHNVRFEALDAQRVGELEVDGPFDVAVALNTLEHVPHVDVVLAALAALLSPDGILVVGVPPVTTAGERLAELANPFHLNIWTPTTWRNAIGLHFGDVRLLRHVFLRADREPDFRAPPGPDSVGADDFRCEPVDSERELRGTYTVVVEARQPRAAPPDAAPMPMHELGDGSITRRPPRLTPLPPDQLDAPALPLRRLPARALGLARSEGAAGLVAEARRWVAWRVRLAIARRHLRGGGS